MCTSVITLESKMYCSIGEPFHTNTHYAVLEKFTLQKTSASVKHGMNSYTVFPCMYICSVFEYMFSYMC